MDFKIRSEAVAHFVDLGYDDETANGEVNKLYPDLPDEVTEEIKVVPIEDVERLNLKLKELSEANTNISEKLEEQEKVYKDLATAVKDRDAKLNRKGEFEVTDVEKKEFKELDSKFLNDVKQHAFDLHLADTISLATSKGRKSLVDFEVKSIAQIFNGDAIAAGYLKKALFLGSANTNLGAEFIPTGFSNQLIDLVRVDRGVLANIVTFETPTNPYKHPIAGTDPTIYHVGETQGAMGAGTGATAIADSDRATDNITFTAEKLAGHSYYDADITEDSIIAIVPFARQGLIEAIGDALERCVLFGDVSTGSSNINHNSASVTTTAGAADYFLAWDGCVHKALKDGGANYVVNAATTLALSHFKEALVKMGRYSLNPQKCAWFMNPTTYNTVLGLSDVLTVDKLGPKATLLTGQLASLWGAPIIPSIGIPLTNDDGMISSTPGNNDQKNALFSYLPGVMLGFQRRAGTIDSEKILETDQYHMVTTVRADLQFPYGSNGQIYIYNAD